MPKTIAVASGKGGTGKTMFVANLGACLAKQGKKVILVDLDTGLRNLDLYLGLENQVVYDVNDVLNGVCRIKQALIKVQNIPNLYFMAASPRPDDGEITPLHVKVLCSKLKEVFDYVLIDCPAGLDDGLMVSMGGADEVILTVNPEVASIRDSEMVIHNLKKFNLFNVHYVLNRVSPSLMKRGLVPSVEEFPSDMQGKFIGVILEDEDIHISTNVGVPVVTNEQSYIFRNFLKITNRIMKL